MWNIFRTCGRDDQQGAVGGRLHPEELQGQEDRHRPRQDHLRPGPCRRDQEGDEQGRHEGSALRGRQSRREGLLRPRLQDQGRGRRPRLLGRPAHRRRPDRAPDARPGRARRAADGRRRHHLRRVRLGRRPRRRRHADDVRPDPRKRPEAKAVVEKFRAKKFEPEAYTLYSYAAVEIIKQAAEAAKSLDPKKVADADQVRPEVQDRDRRDRPTTRRATSRSPDYVMYVWKKDAQTARSPIRS